VNFERIPGIWLLLSSALYALGVATCLFVASHSFAVSFGVGGALVLLNSVASARRLKRAEFPHKNRVMAQLLGGFYVRLIVMAACLYGLIVHLRVDPLGLIAGLSVVPAGLLGMLVLIYIANRRPEEA
jgi:hypothetical protein